MRPQGPSLTQPEPIPGLILLTENWGFLGKQVVGVPRFHTNTCLLLEPQPRTAALTDK